MDVFFRERPNSWKGCMLTVWRCVNVQAETCFLGVTRCVLVFSAPGVRYTHIFWKCCCIFFRLCVILALLSSVPAGSPVQIIPQSIRSPPSEKSKKVPPPTPPKPRRASQYGPLGCGTCLRKLGCFASLNPMLLFVSSSSLPDPVFYFLYVFPFHPLLVCLFWHYDHLSPDFLACSSAWPSAAANS